MNFIGKSQKTLVKQGNKKMNEEIKLEILKEIGENIDISKIVAVIHTSYDDDTPLLQLSSKQINQLSRKKRREATNYGENKIAQTFDIISDAVNSFDDCNDIRNAIENSMKIYYPSTKVVLGVNAAIDVMNTAFSSGDKDYIIGVIKGVLNITTW